MKRNIITITVALVIVGAIVVLNQFEPDRATEEQIEATSQAESQLAQALEAELDFAVLTDNDNEDNESGDNVADENAITLKFECSNGEFTVELYPDWAPLGVKQFLAAIKDGVYDDARFFRVVPGFVVQFGIPGDPKLARKWKSKTIKDDPVTQSNKRGTLTFATSGLDSRTTQLFINLGDANASLDGMGFSPFGRVVDGMDVVDAINSQYGETPSKRQGEIQAQGNAFLDKTFPGLDYIKKITIVNGDD